MKLDTLIPLMQMSFYRESPLFGMSTRVPKKASLAALEDGLGALSKVSNSIIGMDIRCSAFLGLLYD